MNNRINRRIFVDALFLLQEIEENKTFPIPMPEENESEEHYAETVKQWLAKLSILLSAMTAAEAIKYTSRLMTLKIQFEDHKRLYQSAKLIQAAQKITS